MSGMGSFVITSKVKLILKIQILLSYEMTQQEEFENTKVVIRIRKSKKYRQHNGQKDKQRSTKHTYNTKDPVTPTSLKTGGELMCSTSDTRRVNLVTNPMMSWTRKGPEVLTTSGTYPWSFVTQIFHNGQSSHGDDRKSFKVMTST
jgi:hypothetical protein